MTVKLPAAELLEKEWDAQLFAREKGLASMLGWMSYHTLRSRGSQSGYPDRTLARERIIFAELKTSSGRPTPTQREWLDRLARAGGEVYLWRPADLDDIGKILGGRWRYEGLGKLVRDDGPFTTAWVPGSAWVPGVGRHNEAP